MGFADREDRARISRVKMCIHQNADMLVYGKDHAGRTAIERLALAGIRG
jgi:hypothetical protein